MTRRIRFSLKLWEVTETVIKYNAAAGPIAILFAQSSALGKVELFLTGTTLQAPSEVWILSVTELGGFPIF